MKKKLFLALLTTLLLLLAASTALAADYSDYTCTSCGNPCDGWFPFNHQGLDCHAPACYSCGICFNAEAEHCTPVDGSATCKLAPRCSVCSSPMSTEYDPDPNAHDMGNWNYSNATQHFRVCQNGCNTEEYADHVDDNSDGLCDDCSCAMSATCLHAKMSECYYSDDAQHYRFCMVCWDYEVYEDHSGGDGSCMPTCESCNETYYNANGEHRGMTEWSAYDTEQHWRYCQTCFMPETFEYGGHTGGTATCVELATCTACKTAYGVYGGHVGLTDWTMYDGDSHFRYCQSCGSDASNEYAPHADEDKDGRCDDCGHSMATVCQHTSMSDWALFDPQQHYRYCLTCHDYEEYADHTGGTATCESGPICTECGSEYGSPSTVHTNLTDWDWFSDMQHYRFCSDCSYAEYGNHSGGDGSCMPICEDCGETYMDFSGKHSNMSSWFPYDDTQHYRYCQSCGLYREYADHTGGTATCASGPVCEVCNGEYGPSLGGHDWGKWESNDDGTHTRVCSRDAIHKDTGDCSGGTATCVAPAVCAVCETSYGSVDPDAHDLQLDETIPATCIDPGVTRYLCQNEGCPDPVHETVLPAFGQHLYNHWDILGGNMHHTDCAVCGENADVGCTLWGMYDGETLLTVCPVCGDFLDRPFAILIAREDVAVPIGTLLVRGLEAPFEGALYGVTVAGVYGGEVVDIHGTVTIIIPVSCEEFTLVRVEIVEDKEVRTEIPFTLEDGQLTFKTDVAGLFLLVPVE